MLNITVLTCIKIREIILVLYEKYDFNTYLINHIYKVPMYYHRASASPSTPSAPNADTASPVGCAACTAAP